MIPIFLPQRILKSKPKNEKKTLNTSTRLTIQKKEKEDNEHNWTKYRFLTQLPTRAHSRKESCLKQTPTKPPSSRASKAIIPKAMPATTNGTIFIFKQILTKLQRNTLKRNEQNRNMDDIHVSFIQTNIRKCRSKPRANKNSPTSNTIYIEGKKPLHHTINSEVNSNDITTQTGSTGLRHYLSKWIPHKKKKRNSGNEESISCVAKKILDEYSKNIDTTLDKHTDHSCMIPIRAFVKRRPHY